MYDTVTTAALSKIINKPHVCPPNRSRLPTKMNTKGKRPMRSLNLDEKILAIQRVNDGESKASVARDIGVPESTLRGWCKNEDKLRNHSTRKSSPESDKSIDSEPPEKRTRVSPSMQQSSETSGLDLSAPAVQSITPQDDGPVELTTKRTVPSPMSHLPQIPNLETSISFGAHVSTVTGSAGPLSGLTYHGAGYSDPEICLSHKFKSHEQSYHASQHSSRALRSIRSPKPAHNGSLNFTDSKRSRYYSNKLESDILMMLFHSNPALRSPYQVLCNKAADFNYNPTNISLLASLAHANDLNRNLSTSNHRHTGVVSSPPNDAYAPQTVPVKDNILFNQLTKDGHDNKNTTSTPQNVPAHTLAHKEEPRADTNARPAADPTGGPEGLETKTPHQDKDQESNRNQNKGRILDNLFYRNLPLDAEQSLATSSNDEWRVGAAEAVEHGTKFVEWLETSGDPNVTRQHTQQLRVLINNLSARLSDCAHERPSGSAHARTRRK